jgi:AmmeMemoRadiSam system protein B
MVPHAGWRFSGRIAAEVLGGIEIPPTVLVIGPKHTRLGVDYAVAPCSYWQTPGSELRGDAELAELLVQRVPGWQLDAAAHAQEHAIEVELPLVAFRRPSVRIVGVALGPATWEQCCALADGLAAVLKDRMDRVLPLVSSDMNHFATDEENRRLDEIALEALETCQPEYAFRQIRDHGISMCGLVPATVVMLALQQLNQLHRAQRIAYGTSADVTGDTSRVVGYAGMVFD